MRRTKVTQWLFLTRFSSEGFTKMNTVTLTFPENYTLHDIKKLAIQDALRREGSVMGAARLLNICDITIYKNLKLREIRKARAQNKKAASG